MQLEASVDRFIQNFRRLRSAISGLRPETHADQFKKILFVSLIDALASVRNPDRMGRRRFNSFIQEFGRWEDAQRVSLPHLAKLLRAVDAPGFADLRTFVSDQLATWKQGETVLIERDPLLEEVAALWPDDQPRLQGLNAELLQHLNLLYQCRNFLVHQCREPAAKYSDSDVVVPHYVASLGPTEQDSTWLLDYPVDFFKNLVDSCIADFGPFLLQHDINPDEHYWFGKFWYEQLNR